MILQGVPPIARGRFQSRRKDTGKRLRINERIRKDPVRLIDENNEQVGVTPTAEAMQRARAAGLDLVEVAPNSDPPVCRIMDYGKWKYQQRKKEQKNKAHAKQSELKEVRLRPGTDEHDLKIKTDRARGFLEEGHKVQFTILFRGRQMAHRDIGFKLFTRIAETFADAAHIEVSPRVQGRRMTMMLAPGVKAPRPPQPKAKARADKAEAPPERPESGPERPPAAAPAPPQAAAAPRPAPQTSRT